MKVKEVAALIERFAPLAWQEEYDNCGLNIGSYEAEVTGILLCVDVTEAVLDEAKSLGANLVVSHHPLLFHPLRQLVDADYVQRVAARAVREGISLYAAHTSLDSAPGGMSFRLGEILGLTDMELLDPRADGSGSGFGVVGRLAAPCPMRDFLKQVQQRLSVGAIRHSALSRDAVQRVALCTGAGGSLIRRAMDSGADLYLSADLRYNDFFVPESGMVIADVGHFESEYCAIALLHDIITKKIATFAVHKSEHSINPVNYLV